VERISFTSPTLFRISQNETAWFAGDQWAINPRLTLSFGLRFDNDTITSSTHAAPRTGFLLSLTGDGKTLLKAALAGFMTASRSRLPRSLIFRIALSLWSTRTAWRLVLCPIRTK